MKVALRFPIPERKKELLLGMFLVFGLSYITCSANVHATGAAASPFHVSVLPLSNMNHPKMFSTMDYQVE